MEKNITKTIKRGIAGFAACVFLLSMTDAAQASVLFLSAPADSHSLSVQSNFQANSKISGQFHFEDLKASTFSVMDLDEAGNMESAWQCETVSNPSESGSDFSLENKIFFNQSGQVKIILNYGDEGISSRRDFFYLENGTLERVDERSGEDPRLPVVTSTFYEGSAGNERADFILAFDGRGNLNTISNLKYDSKTGALKQIEQSTLSGEALVIQKRFYYEGASGKELVVEQVSYDGTGTHVIERLDYIYEGDALRELLRRKTDNSALPITNRTVFTGFAGEEKIQSQFSYDQEGKPLLRTDFIYDENGDLIQSETREGDDLELPHIDVTFFEKNMPSYSLNYDSNIGRVIYTSEYEYNKKGMFTKLHIREGNRTASVRATAYMSGEYGNEFPQYLLTYDYQGVFQNRHDLSYDSSMNLTQVITRSVNDPKALNRIVTVFNGNQGEAVPEYAVTYDSTGNMIERTQYSFSSASNVNRPDSTDASRSAVLTNESSFSGKNSAHLTSEFHSDLFKKFQIADHKDSAHNLQGILSPIEVRAGPLKGAII